MGILRILVWYFICDPRKKNTINNKLNMERLEKPNVSHMCLMSGNSLDIERTSRCQTDSGKGNWSILNK